MHNKGICGSSIGRLQKALLPTMNLRAAFACGVSSDSRRASTTFVVLLIAILVFCPKDAAQTTLVVGKRLLCRDWRTDCRAHRRAVRLLRLSDQRGNTIGWCVLATYVSALVAGLVRGKFEPFANLLLGEHPFENPAWTSALLALALGIPSVFIEWPFLRGVWVEQRRVAKVAKGITRRSNGFVRDLVAACLAREPLVFDGVAQRPRVA